MDRERNYVAAEDVNAVNLLKANLQSTNHKAIDISPCRQVEVLQSISNINIPLSFSHKLTAKFKQQREQRLARSHDEETKALNKELEQLIKRLNDFGDNLNASPNTQKMVTTLHTQCKESISPFSHVPM